MKAPKLTEGALGFSVSLVLGVAMLSAPAIAQNKHEDGKNPFKDALRTTSPSIARADLLACEQLGQAQFSNLSDLNVEDFARTLSGTWKRELTWYGIQVQNESAMYFDFVVQDGKAVGDAMMFDQSNLGKGPLSVIVDRLKKDPDALATTPTLVYVDCDYSMVDRYYKISDDLIFDGLDVPRKSYPASLKKNTKSPVLGNVWSALNSNGFFDRRFPIVEGTPEMLLPSIGGSYWAEASLTRSQGHQSTAGALLNLSGEYKFVHAGDEVAYSFNGREVGQFDMEGEAFVASKRALGSQSSGSNPTTSIIEGMDTDCDEIFFAIPVNYERVVLEPMIGASLQATPKSAAAKKPASK